MAKINEFGEIIRDEKDNYFKDNSMSTFTPPKPKMKLDNNNLGDKILQTGQYEYGGVQFDLKTLENLTYRLETEIKNGKDETIYSEEILTIAMQILKKANQEILKSSQVTPAKEQKLAQIEDRQNELLRTGYTLNAGAILNKPEKAQEYMMALQQEMSKQKEQDTQKMMKEKAKFEKRMPNISAKTATVLDER